MGSSEVPQQTGTPEPTVTPTPTPPPPPADEEKERLKTKLAEYERLVLTPEYAEFLQQKAAGPKPPAPLTREQREEYTERLNNMTRAELISFVRDAVVKDVREQLFDPLAQTVVQREVQQQIAVAAAKYPDFWDHRDKMIEISRSNPNLNAEQCFLLAKGVKSSAEPQKPPAKPTEVPGGAPTSGPKPKEKMPFNEAFEEAFKKSGIKT